MGRKARRCGMHILEGGSSALMLDLTYITP